MKAQKVKKIDNKKLLTLGSVIIKRDKKLLDELSGC